MCEDIVIFLWNATYTSLNCLVCVYMLQMLVVLFLFTESGEEHITAEVKSTFSLGTSQEAASTSREGSDLIARATRLCKDLRSDSSKILSRHSRRQKRRTASAPYTHTRQYQKGLVVIDYPGPCPAAVMTLREYEKVFDGSIRFSGSMDEDDIREEIVRVVSSKEGDIIHDLSNLQPQDFIFVKCSNKSGSLMVTPPLMPKESTVHTRMDPCTSD